MAKTLSGQQTSLFHPPFAVGLAVIVLLTLSGLQNHYRGSVENDGIRHHHDIGDKSGK
jgi:hypothetical protein